MISCEHGTRRVTRTEHDGSITVIADAYGGKSLNSPNDVIVKSDGTIWFSDPHYGIMTNYEGFAGKQELPCHVYRADPVTGALDVVVEDMQCPNGLAFSPDDSLLYVADTGRIFSDDEQHIRVYKCASDGALSDGRHFHTIDPGAADGIRLDQDGNNWSSAADGVHCIAPSGELMGKTFCARTGIQPLLRWARQTRALHHRNNQPLPRNAQSPGCSVPLMLCSRQKTIDLIDKRRIPELWRCYSRMSSIQVFAATA